MNQSLTKNKLREKPKANHNISTGSTAEPKSYEQKIAWVYLLNLVFFFVPLYFVREQWLNVAVSLTLLIPFIYSYFWAYTSTADKAKYPLLLMLASAVAAAPFSSGSLSFFSFLSFFIGFFYPLKRAISLYLGLVAILFTLNYLIGYPQLYFALYGSGICLVVGMFGVIEHNRQKNIREQRQSQDEIAQLAKSLERERIGRDLHDIVGHQLASIALKAELADKLINAGKTKQAQTQIQQLADISRESLSQIRQAVSDYKLQGLQQVILNLIAILRDKGIAVTLNGELPNLTELQQSQLGLIMTEAVNNMLKHSRSESCVINCQVIEDTLILELIESAAAKSIAAGNGVNGMHERAQMIGAELVIEAKPVMRLTVSLPLQAS
ncbi:sensor histidine kinase [Shewanella sp. WXL01]|uniref:sensor histidine kinase n=1 Tax=Shewanella sp. WXL01 TaxID=2709721 RepID=UPI0014386B15|nr:histidine kinase [Shewanella sp. WXL01]NKF52173.1 sensor histidine kinase [Shewanella sp. WXL01]